MTGKAWLAALLSAAAWGAQIPKLPWEEANLPPWIAEQAGPVQEAPPPPAGSKAADLSLTLAQDGRLRVADRKGTLRMSLGLPGRPQKVWRDGGIALEPTGTWRFPALTPLSERQASRLLTDPDPRSALSGLLWVLDDSERRLTVVHPATARVLFLRLPDCETPELAFFPDRLELRAGAGMTTRRWSIPWAALLPHLARLGLAPNSAPRGTALQPYPPGE